MPYWKKIERDHLVAQGMLMTRGCCLWTACMCMRAGLRFEERARASSRRPRDFARKNDPLCYASLHCVETVRSRTHAHASARGPAPTLFIFARLL
jgi:hypothetical protein